MYQDHNYSSSLPDISHCDAGNQHPDPPSFLSWPSWDGQDILPPGWWQRSDGHQLPPAYASSTPEEQLTYFAPPSKMSQSLQDATLSPIPLQGMQQLLPYMDTITPPTPPVPEYSEPSPSTVYHTPHTSLVQPDPLTIPHTHISPSIPYLPIPAANSSPYMHVSSPVLPSPNHSQSFSPMPPSPCLSQRYSPIFPSAPLGISYRTEGDSPAMVSSVSFHSFSQANSPAMASVSSFYSLSQANSPTISGSTLPFVEPLAEGRPLPERVPIPQTVELSPKRNISFTESFKSGGASGVSVRDVLKNRVMLDGHDERVLERTGVRQIRVVIAWPGYANLGTYIIVQEKGGFITRGRLAMSICVHISKFMNKAAKKCPPREHAQWTIGNGGTKRGISIDNLWLLSVTPARHNIWLAELEVLL